MGTGMATCKFHGNGQGEPAGRRSLERLVETLLQQHLQVGCQFEDEILGHAALDEGARDFGV